ncbi:SEC12 [Auxenochlorella protothecoides x Auxenochlorella symbiontica]
MKRRAPLQKYGAPLYGVAWPDGPHAYMAGGGNLGIENKVVVVSCDERGKLSDEVTKYNTGDDAPYRMAMHPSGRSLVLGMTRGGVQGVDLQPSTSGRDAPELSRPGGSFASRAPSIGALKCLSFSSDGRLLVMGGEDGSVRIVHWPSLEPKLHWQASEDKAIRAADLSRAHSDGILTTTDEAGMAALWNAETGDKVLQLAVPQDMPRATFFKCITLAEGAGPAIYTAVKWKGEGHILRWRQLASGEIRLEARSRGPVTRSPICGFVASPSGRLLGAVTPDGDQVVVTAGGLRRVLHRRGAHMTFATAIAFSPDEKWVLSTSADASAVLTRVPSGSLGAHLAYILALLAALLAVAAHFFLAGDTRALLAARGMVRDV